jgi:hypothetical protein
MSDHHPLYGAAASRFLDAAFARIITKLDDLYEEGGRDPIRIVAGLFLVLDHKNGGDSTSEELIRRFRMLDLTSENIIDFYYLGWSEYSGGLYDPKQELEFCLPDFQACRRTLKKDYGVSDFGGYADLILVDAERDTSGNYPRYFLHFEEAIRIDLAKSIKSGDIPSLAEFLESLIKAADEFRSEQPTCGGAYYVSDKLGLMYAKQSLLTSIFDKWGKFIGANTLKHLVVRNLGGTAEIYPGDY